MNGNGFVFVLAALAWALALDCTVGLASGYGVRFH